MDKQARRITLHIKRQDDPQSQEWWETFVVDYRPRMTVISCLAEIRTHPFNAKNQKSTPVAWESGCLENQCGACSMLINGRPQQACMARVDTLPQPIVLEPLSKFAVIRDLVVDRSRLFQQSKAANAWIPTDGIASIGPPPPVNPDEAELRAQLSSCQACGICLEVCPQYNDRSPFIGPALLNQLRQLNHHPIGKQSRNERLDLIMGEGGVADCGNAQNCVKACPKGIPLIESIAELNRETTWHTFFRWLSH